MKEHGPKSAAEASMLADVFVTAHNKNLPWTYNGWMAGKAGKDGLRLVTFQFHQGSAVGRPLVKVNQLTPSKASRATICYLSVQQGHIKPLCPKSIAKLTQMCFVPRKKTVYAMNKNDHC